MAVLIFILLQLRSQSNTTKLNAAVTSNSKKVALPCGTILEGVLGHRCRVACWEVGGESV